MRAAVLLLVAVACSADRRVSSDEDRVTIEPPWSFSDEHRAEIEAAATTWSALTVPEKRIVFERDGDWRIIARDPCTGYNGHTDPTNQIVIVIPTPGSGATVYAVALHEFGHVLGLTHTATGVMQSAVVSVEITPDVMAECRRVSACR